MKYAGIVLRNRASDFSQVDGSWAFDALRDGGVYLDEVCVLSYDKPVEITAALNRLYLECDGVFAVCDTPLMGDLKEKMAFIAERSFEEEYLLETQRCLFAVLPSGKRGQEVAKLLLLPKIEKRRGAQYRCVVKAMAPNKENLKRAIDGAIEAGKGTVSVVTSEHFGDMRIEMSYGATASKAVVDEAYRILLSELGEFVYALEDEKIEQRLFEVLSLHRYKIATAESFTAGGVGQAIVSIPGASAVFYEGLNTYDNGSKMERLGVLERTLKSYGAVSDEVAYEMAVGLLEKGNCDIALSTTGIAGPKSDDSQKPVGLCYLAVGTKERVRVFRYQLAGDRERITKTATNIALFLAYREAK